MMDELFPAGALHTDTASTFPPEFALGPPPPAAPPAPIPTVEVWGLPLARLDYAQTLDAVEGLIDRRRPAFFITANLHYAMLTRRDRRLARVNRQAAFLLADGMPMVWYSRLLGKPLPQRVAGSDLIYDLCRRAAEKGHRVFLLGGAPGVGHQAAARLQERYPGLKIVGVEAPALATLNAQEHEMLLQRIRRARPDLLFVAFGQPKGELWLAAHCPALGVPACVQVGASFDFVVGRARRAPRWMQRTGLEWLYRMLCEPRRLVPRYAANAWFLATAIGRDAVRGLRRKRASG